MTNVRSPKAFVLALTVVSALILSTQMQQATVSSRLGKARTLAQETAERDLTTALRLTARRHEKGAGRLGRTSAIKAAPAPGWTGERLMDPTADDWEPAVGTDPAAPYVYMATTRYGGAKACRSCPDPAIVVATSSDGGATFGPARFICSCRNVKGQHDPELEVASDGTVYAVWMNDFNPGVVFSKSTDRGQTWSTPIALDGKLSWSDKPILAISPTGRDVYVVFNHSDSYVASSHNFGQTFSAPVKTNNDNRYHFAGGGFVAANGTVTFSETSYTQSSTGPVIVRTIRSTDGGASWNATVVDTVQEQPPCTDVDCPPDYYGPQTALAGDAGGRLALLYQGASTPGGPQRMYARSSTNAGATWGARVDVTGAPAGTNAAFPAAAGTGAGDFRAWFMDDRNGGASWNVWYIRSTDGGTTWSAPVRLSDATSGTVYKNASGFNEPYGDYGEIEITNAGKNFAVWGEGISYVGPGGTWFARSI